jgi:hypothetical protein
MFICTQLSRACIGVAPVHNLIFKIDWAHAEALKTQWWLHEDPQASCKGIWIDFQAQMQDFKHHLSSATEPLAASRRNRVQTIPCCEGTGSEAVRRGPGFRYCSYSLILILALFVYAWSLVWHLQLDAKTTRCTSGEIWALHLNITQLFWFYRPN